jgi:hypothetical protein
MRGVFQIMTVPGIEIKRGERIKLRQRREPERVHPPPQQCGTVRHHAEASGTSERFKVRPDLNLARPEPLEGLKEIPPTARVGQHTLHALGQPVPIRFGGTVPNRGGLVIDREQRFKKLETHFRRNAR